MTSSRTWKNFEAQAASMFGAKRMPLSGASGNLPKGDAIHSGLHIEAKYRAELPMIKEGIYTFDGIDFLFCLAEKLREQSDPERIGIYKRSFFLSTYKNAEKSEGNERTIVTAFKHRNMHGFYLFFKLSDYQKIVDYVV